MLHPQDIIRLYATILFHDIRQRSVSDDDMKAAIGDMQRVYKPEPGCLSSSARRLADYNSMAYRCAYLHKYAPFHTAMVGDIMRWILQQNDNMFFVFQKKFTKRQKFKICSLGGGPGSDIVGVLVAMFEHFGLFPCSAKVIDIKSDWKDTFTSVIRGLGSGMYGPVGEGFTPWNFNWDYLTADLLEEVHDDVKSAIGSAELVTMVKFVSAAACESTEWMLKKIFTMLKLGAVVLFIDNSSGGFRQLVAKAADDCKMTSVCGPINYQLYTNEAFNITHWDITSCYSTTVTVHMMQKLHPTPHSINIMSKTADSAPKRNELPTPSSNGIAIQKNFTTQNSNGTLFQNIIPTPSSNGITIRNTLPASNSNLNPIRQEHPTPSNNDTSIRRERPTPNRRGDAIQKESSIIDNCIQTELPISSSHSNPIQSELVSICHTLINEIPSVCKHSNPTKTLIENQSDFQSKCPVGENIENGCVPSIQKNGMYATEVPTIKETQNTDSCVSLSLKTDNGQPNLCKDIMCTTVNSKSKKRKGAIQSNENDFSDFTINEDDLCVSSTNNDGICATGISKSRDSYNHDRGEESYTLAPVLILAFLILMTYFIKKIFI